MKKLFQEHKLMQIVLGILILAAGALITVFAYKDTGAISKVFSIILAIALFLDGTLVLLTSLRSMTKDYFKTALIAAAVIISIGVVLIIRSDVLGDLVAYFASILVVSIGSILLINATALLLYKRPVIIYVIFYILGAIILAGGIFMLIKIEEVSAIVYMVFGVVISLYGIYQIVLGIINMFKREKAEIIIATEVDDKNKFDPNKKEESEQKSNKKSKNIQKDNLIESSNSVAEIDNKEVPQIETKSDAE